MYVEESSERWTNKTRRRSLPASDQDLKCKRKEYIEVEKLSSNNGAETNGGLKIKQSLDDGAAHVLDWVPYAHVDKPSNHTKAESKLECIDWANPLSSRSWRWKHRGGWWRVYDRRGLQWWWGDNDWWHYHRRQRRW